MAAEIPRGDLPLGILTNTILQNLTVLGDLFWLVAYLLIIVRCFRQRTYGIPLLAVAMNFSWEVQYTLVRPPLCDDGRLDVVKLAFFLGWLLLDLLIVWQVIRYGRKEQAIPAIQHNFFPVLAATFAYCWMGHVAWARYVTFEAPQVDAYIINLVMSILFIFFLYSRPHLRGISYGGAWFKFLGTGVISFANFFQMGQEPKKVHYFYYLLFGGVFFFDALYVFLVHQQRGALTPEPAAAPAAA